MTLTAWIWSQQEFGTNTYVMYLPNRQQTRAVRTCIDFLMDKALTVED